MTSRKIARDYLGKVEARLEALRLFAALRNPRGGRRAIERRNELDLALHDYAARLFDGQLQGVGLEGRAVDHFRACHRVHAAVWGPVVRTARRAKAWVRSR